MSKKLPIVAIIGRTNVGKSTLFNRLLERQKSIISHLPGTTRDRTSGFCHWRGRKFILMDSGGLDINRQVAIEKDIRRQAEKAVLEANLILLMLDGQQGFLKQDREIALKLKKIAKPKILVVNKVDHLKIRQELTDNFYRLGLGKPFYISSLNGNGTGDLLEEILKKIPTHFSNIKEPDLKIAVLGKTNVGKSAFVNALLGEERIIVSPLPHTTRDPQEVEFKYLKKSIVLIDTAGLRRKKPEKGKSEEKYIEKESAKKSLLALKKSDVALLMIDVTDQVSFQDRHIADEILKANNGLVLVLNKWDLVQNKTQKAIKHYIYYLQSNFPFLLWAPYIFVSAIKKIRLKRVLDFALKIKENRERWIEPEKLKDFIVRFDSYFKQGKKIKIKLPNITILEQTNINPPQFLLLIEKAGLPKAYFNSLEKALRSEFGFWGTPIIINQRTDRDEINYRVRKSR